MSWTLARQRALALGLGTGLTAFALWGALWVVIVAGSAAQLPDRLAMDGDPCCPVPDTWGDVAAWSTIGLVLALLDAGALVLGAAFLSFAVRSRWPGRRVVWLPLAAVTGCVGLIVLGLLLRPLMQPKRLAGASAAKPPPWLRRAHLQVGRSPTTRTSKRATAARRRVDAYSIEQLIGNQARGQ